ncbi:MAG TPA: YceD family protein [Acetobacteraceae bacterium]|jgi:uncharacterized metal-binding protein YceD (DUF177 family)|nr:YceD family protein [Acetobacteraceae bacterium]
MRPEFSRPLSLARIGAGQTVAIEATPAERTGLAKRLQIPELPALDCSFVLRPVASGVVEAEGVLRARVVQECVVSLDPFEATVEERFALRFVPEGRESPTIDPDATDEVPYPGNTIDLGEAAAEQLALALDPYPRKPGVALPEGVETEPPDIQH